MTGAGVLLRLALRRSRVMLASWVVVLAALVALTASSFAGLYATPAARQGLVTGAGTAPATLALYGRIYADSVGGLTAWRLGAFTAALAGVMSVLLVVRHTRADEEAGRAELLGAGVLGRHAPLAAALAVAAVADAALALLCFLGLVAAGLPAVGSLALAVSIGAGGVVFAAVAAVSAQVATSARAANGASMALLGAAYLVRAIGDAGPHWLSWLSPLGWLQALRPYAGEQWWTLLLPLALAAALVALAASLVTRRDLGAGLVAPSPGPARGALATPFALAWRLERGALAGWAAGFAVAGAAAGSVTSGIDNLVGDNPGVRKLLAELGGQRALGDAYLVTTLQVVGAIAACFGLQAALRVRAEETSGRAEPLLAAAVSRTRWALGYFAIAAGGIVVLLAAAGLATGAGYAITSGDAAQVGRVLGAALAQAPGAWVLAGLAAALVGLAPRAASASWAVLGLSLALTELGPVLHVSAAASPFTHAPLPGGTLTAAPLGLTALALALAAAGLFGLRRRDLG